MGGLFAYLAAEAVTAAKRKATTYGILVAGGALFFFAAAYALDAAYVWIALRQGPIAASLIVAGVLLALAIIMVIAARVAARGGRPAEQIAARASPYSHAPFRRPYSGRRVVAVMAALAGAGSAAAALAKFKSLRTALKRL